MAVERDVIGFTSTLKASEWAAAAAGQGRVWQECAVVLRLLPPSSPGATLNLIITKETNASHLVVLVIFSRLGCLLTETTAVLLSSQRLYWSPTFMCRMSCTREDDLRERIKAICFQQVKPTFITWDHIIINTLYIYYLWLPLRTSKVCIWNSWKL